MKNSDDRSYKRYFGRMPIVIAVIATIVFWIVPPKKVEEMQEWFQMTYLGIGLPDEHRIFLTYLEEYEKWDEIYGHDDIKEPGEVYSYRLDLKKRYDDYRKPLDAYKLGQGKLPQCKEGAADHCYISNHNAEDEYGNKFSYYGEMLDGEYHGIGEQIFEDGEKYVGYWSDGLSVDSTFTVDKYDYPYEFFTMQDDGTQNGPAETYYDNFIYIGNMIDYKADGYGESFNPENKSYYKGFWSENFWNGEGAEFNKYRSDNIFLVRGDFKDNQAHGKAIMITKDTIGYSVYKGRMEFGTPHGEGTYKYSNGDNHSGSFYRGLLHGHGIYTYAYGDSYEGNYEYGKLDDKRAIVKYQNGSKYVGGFTRDQKHGEGYFTDINQSQRELRNHKNGLKHGKNIFIYESETQTLNYKEDLLHGDQKIEFNNGEVRQYSAFEGLVRGDVFITYENGSKERCNYDNERITDCIVTD